MAEYTVLALNMEGKKEVLGLYLSDSEGANFWLSVLTDLQNRGVEDILIASVDGLTGFPEAIASIYPQAEVQLCIVHQIRNSLRYVASKNHKAFMVDLKRVYRAASLGAAEAALDELESLWGEKYPIVIKSWRTKWEHLSAYFKYPEDIRRIILYHQFHRGGASSISKTDQDQGWLSEQRQLAETVVHRNPECQ